MRPLRIATVGAAAALTLAAVLVPAQAAMAAVTGSFTPSVVAPGGTVEVTGSGCPVDGEVVVTTWITSLGATEKATTVTADATGAFSAIVAVHGAPGELPEVTPPHSQFGVNVGCGGENTVLGFGALSFPGAPLAATFSPRLIIAPGDDVTITGTGCDAGESVFLAVWFPGGTPSQEIDTVADASGDFGFVVETPSDGLPGGVITFEFTCGGPLPMDDPADYLRWTLLFEAAPVDPVDPTDPADPADPADPTVPTDPAGPTDPTDPAGPGAGAGGTPSSTDTTTPAVVRPKLAATGADVGVASVALALLLAGATLVGLRRSRRIADSDARTRRTAR